jgi:hypothetical protein
MASRPGDLLMGNFGIYFVPPPHALGQSLCSFQKSGRRSTSTLGFAYPCFGQRTFDVPANTPGSVVLAIRNSVEFAAILLLSEDTISSSYSGIAKSNVCKSMSGLARYPNAESFGTPIYRYYFLR